MPLLQRTACLCGKTEATSFGVKDEIELIRCMCGIVRRADLDVQDYTAQYMSGFYHNDNIQTVVGKAIKDRFEHDLQVGRERLTALANLIEEFDLYSADDHVLLDVGCGNGAFVRAALEFGYDAYGIDLYIPDLEPAYADALKNRLEVAPLSDCRFTRRTVDVLVLNDVIEHVVDPLLLLRQAAAIVKRNGIIVVDTPDFGNLSIDNHHVKPAEHIWYAAPTDWLLVFERAGLAVKSSWRPIEGKVVYYLTDDQHVQEVIVRGPTGLGDVHWILLKMTALRAAEAPCLLTMAIPGNGDPEMIGRAKGFLDMLPFLDTVRVEIGPPVIIDSGADNVSEPSYSWIANGHLERGRRIEDWNPHLAVDFNYPVVLPQEARAFAEATHATLGNPKLVVLYASSKAWNHAVTGGSGWTADHWAALCARLTEAGIVPVLIGKHWDGDYSSEFSRKVKTPFLNLTGKTSEAECLALFDRASAVIGMCSGITILAAHMRAPSIVFWPEVGKGLHSPMEFHLGFQSDWVDPTQLADQTYVPLSLGAFDVSTIVGHLERWGVL